MFNFDKQIQDFKKYGTYTYVYDGNGNLIFNSSSVDFHQVYLALPLVNLSYNASKLESMYDPTFTEFIPSVELTDAAINETTGSADVLAVQLEVIQDENTALKSQLDELIATVEVSNASQINPTAIKQVILELRKSLGQGRVDSDFSDTFPYSALRKNTT